jgi:N6-L-threonylcarbamoyladenine synthase
MQSSPTSSGLILGIESSCDETAAAVVRDGRIVLANVVSSQAALHAAYGGVVPEIASREHLRHIVPVVRQAIAQAGIAFSDLDAVAVTHGPGLAGALLVGILYAKALAFALGKPLIAVNHLEGHIHAVLMGSDQLLVPHPRPSFTGPRVGPNGDAPLLALVVSGGHTHLYLASQHPETAAWTYTNVGRTIDDAAGEAFDKVAKLLGLGYPGGPILDALAPLGNPAAVPFTFNQLKPSDAAAAPRFDFSFSGIKTAVLRYTQTHAMSAAIDARRMALVADPAANPATLCDAQTLDLIASFQAAVTGNLIRQSLAAAQHYGARGILVSGGVAANRELRRRFTAAAAERNLPIAFPGPSLATDNAAMIAAAAWPRLLNRDYAAPTLTATPQLKLG